ncbi:MAG: hypothetical protein IJ542_03205 [Clostridia bacterium]|nr:hypothetical protein [Clostridia bacterium]
MDKVKSYIGFAKASRAIVFGQNTIEKTKHICGIVCSDKLTANTISKLKTYSENLIVLSEENYNKLNLAASAFAITDKSLMTAIQTQLKQFGGK